MTRKYNVKIRDNDTGKLLLTIKANVERKEQSKGRVAGNVIETLFVDDLRFIEPKKKKSNATAGARVQINTQDFGEILKRIAEGYIESVDTNTYSIQSFFADLANMLRDEFESEQYKNDDNAKELLIEIDALAEKLEDPFLLEKQNENT
jgi:hypothetical protein